LVFWLLMPFQSLQDLRHQNAPPLLAPQSEFWGH
jgi:hypothetical protein